MSRAQANMTWGDQTVVSGSDSGSGYRLIESGITKADATEVAIPGTTGRFRLVLGFGHTRDTSRSWRFECERRFSSSGPVPMSV